MSTLNEIGQAINSLRKMARLSQEELSRDICSQAQLSKIENKNENPSETVLYKLSKKLGVDMNYFFEITETQRLDYLKKVKELIEECKRERDYQRLRKILKAEMLKPIFQGSEKQQYLLWHEAICIHYLEQDSDNAIHLLHHALTLSAHPQKRFYRETELEILNSMAIMRKDQKQYVEAEKLFRQCLNTMKFAPLSNKILKIRLLYGFSKLLTDIGRYEESKELCIEGVALCKRNEVLYLFGELQYQLGSNYARMGERNSAIEAFERAIKIFEIQDNQEFVKQVHRFRKELLGI